MTQSLLHRPLGNDHDNNLLEFAGQKTEFCCCWCTAVQQPLLLCYLLTACGICTIPILLDAEGPKVEKDVRRVAERHARLRRRHTRVEGKRGHSPLPQGESEVSQDDADQDRAGGCVQ